VVSDSRHHRSRAAELAGLAAVVGVPSPPHEVVVGDEQGTRGFVVFQLLAESIRQAAEPLAERSDMRIGRDL
jgi:hypothetical protein